MKKIIKKLKNLIKRGLNRLGFNKENDSWIISKDEIFKYLPSNPVIIDCGAHIGTDAVEFAANYGSIIYAFEPVNDIFRQLIDNTKKYSNIACFNVALSSYDGFADMYISSGYSDGSSSLLKPSKHLEYHPDVFFNNIERVKCSKLDTWADQNSVKHVDMLWLDMQGAEHMMLLESKTILNTVSVIHTEVSLVEIYDGMGSYGDFKKFLQAKGFKAVIEAIPKDNYGGNVLFVKKVKI
jgi:FkbM family methyltransferase